MARSRLTVATRRLARTAIASSRVAPPNRRKPLFSQLARLQCELRIGKVPAPAGLQLVLPAGTLAPSGRPSLASFASTPRWGRVQLLQDRVVGDCLADHERSAERRVGKECRSRW